VYVDNQSICKDVWFDDIHIEHYTSEVLEEDHYYPFGLTVGVGQAGQSNLPAQPIKFQGQRHDNDLGINIYSFKYREHDPTIGRFWQVDSLAADYVHNSPYAFSENHVISHVELEGLEKVSIQDLWRSVGISSSSDPNKFVASVGKEFLKPSSWFEATAIAGQIVASAAIVAIVTSGIGEALVVEAEVSSLRGGGMSPRISTSLATELEGAPTTIAESEVIIKPRNSPVSEGIPNSSKIDAKDVTGKTTKYSTYGSDGKIIKQVEADRGIDRHGVGGATQKVPSTNTLPDGTQKPGKFKIQPATPEETHQGTTKSKCND
jgi:RHS repeat-associated protein